MRKNRAYELLAEDALAKVFLIVNAVLSAIVFKWNEFFIYLSKAGENGCRSIPAIIPTSSKISFGVYDSASSYGFDFILPFLSVMFSIFYLPSYVAAMIIVSAMKNDYPRWCIETFDLIFIPIFAVINTAYLILLSLLIKRLHDFHCENKPVRKNRLSIFLTK